MLYEEMFNEMHVIGDLDRKLEANVRAVMYTSA